jgi:hypothetical protein
MMTKLVAVCLPEDVARRLRNESLDAQRKGATRREVSITRIILEALQERWARQEADHNE